MTWRELNDDEDNIRVAVEWVLEQEDGELGLRLGGALWLFWTRPDRRARGREWLIRLLALPQADCHARLRLAVVVGLAYLSLLQGDGAEAVRLVEHLDIEPGVGEQKVLSAVAACIHGRALADLGNFTAAEPLLRAAVRPLRRPGRDRARVQRLTRRPGREPR